MIKSDLSIPMSEECASLIIQMLSETIKQLQDKNKETTPDEITFHTCSREVDIKPFPQERCPDCKDKTGNRNFDPVKKLTKLREQVSETNTYHDCIDGNVKPFRAAQCDECVKNYTGLARRNFKPLDRISQIQKQLKDKQLKAEATHRCASCNSLWAIKDSVEFERLQAGNNPDCPHCPASHMAPISKYDKANAALKENALLKMKLQQLEQELMRLPKNCVEWEDSWTWQGDGSDSLNSLVCPILIQPQQLRDIINYRDKRLESERVPIASIYQQRPWWKKPNPT